MLCVEIVNYFVIMNGKKLLFWDVFATYEKAFCQAINPQKYEIFYRRVVAPTIKSRMAAPLETKDPSESYKFPLAVVLELFSN